MSKQIAVNSFNEGLATDFNALAMPKTTMTDCLNGTIITYNGNEFILQNDMGNAKVEHSSLPSGYIPIGMKEYGGIIYIASLNPETNDCQIGSIPSPLYDTVPLNQSRDGVLIEYDGTNTAKTDFTTIFTKLFEPEQLTLHPGDQYKLVYTYNGVAETTFKNKFKLNYYMVSENGTRYKLENPNIVMDETSPFMPFKSTIAAVLAVEISINSLSYFDVAVREQTNSTNPDKRVAITIVGKDNTNSTIPTTDDIFCNGARVKIKINDEVQNPLYITRDNYLTSGITKTVTVQGFAQKDIVEFNITPFNQYNYDNKLTQKTILTIGQTIATDATKNKYFQYNLTDGILRLDFDMNVMDFINPKLYVEFYDLWSDYSVIIPIEDINPIGKNSIFVDTINEPGTDVFTNIIRGGTSYDYLMNSTDQLYKPLMNGVGTGRGLIRKTQTLRANHLYAVRICAIETGITIPVYYNIYKLFFNNNNFNTIYNEVRVNPSDVRYDFTQLPQPKTSFTVTSKATVPNEDVYTYTTENTNLDLITTTDSYYKLSNALLPIKDTIVTSSDVINVNRVVNITAEVNKPYNLFGKLIKTNEEIIVTVNKSLYETDTTLLGLSTLTHTGSGTIDNYNLNLAFQTKRTIRGKIFEDLRKIRKILNTITIWNTIYTDPRPAGHSNKYDQFFVPPATDTNDTLLYNLEKDDDAIGIFRHFWSGNGIRRVTRVSAYIPDGATYKLVEYNTNRHTMDNDAISWFMKADGLGTTGNINSKYSGAILHFKSRPFAAAGSIYTYDPYYALDHSPDLWERDPQTMIFMKGTNDENYSFIPYNDINAAKRILKDLCVYNFIENDSYLYYFPTITANQLSTSTAKVSAKINVSLNTKVQHILKFNDLVYTDLTSTHLKSVLPNLVSATSDTNKNLVTFNFIDSYCELINSSVIAEGINIPLNNFEVKASSNPIELNKFRSSKSDLETLEQTQLISSTKLEGTVYSDSGDLSSTQTALFKYQPTNNVPMFRYTSTDKSLGYWAIANEPIDHLGDYAGYGPYRFNREIDAQ